jgi:hypothetical protein
LLGFRLASHAKENGGASGSDGSAINLRQRPLILRQGFFEPSLIFEGLSQVGM